MNPKPEMQKTCPHPNPEEIAQPTREYYGKTMQGEAREVRVRHMHCPRCGMFFGVEDWS